LLSTIEKRRVFGNVTDRREEIDRVFGRALSLIETALVTQYGLPTEEAKGVEQSLYEWFHGFARRPGSPPSGESLRPHLLLMACQAGHVYWCGKMAEELPADDVKRALTLGPQQIAIELAAAAEDGEVINEDEGRPKVPGGEKGS
jgi:hypothetical protein